MLFQNSVFSTRHLHSLCYLHFKQVSVLVEKVEMLCQLTALTAVWTLTVSNAMGQLTGQDCWIVAHPIYNLNVWYCWSYYLRVSHSSILQTSTPNSIFLQARSVFRPWLILFRLRQNYPFQRISSHVCSLTPLLFLGLCLCSVSSMSFFFLPGHNLSSHSLVLIPPSSFKSITCSPFFYTIQSCSPILISLGLLSTKWGHGLRSNSFQF